MEGLAQKIDEYFEMQKEKGNDHGKIKERRVASKKRKKTKKKRNNFKI